MPFSAKQKGNLDSHEQIKAKREIGNVVEGHYDHLRQQGFSMKRQKISADLHIPNLLIFTQFI